MSVYRRFPAFSETKMFFAQPLFYGPMHRSRRWPLKATVVLALLLCATLAAMWRRSCHVLDQISIVNASGFIDVNVFSGRLQISTDKFYRVRPEAPAGFDPLTAPSPYRFLKVDSNRMLGIGRYGYITRSRWPLRQTYLWKPEAPLLPPVRVDSWLTFDPGDPHGYCRVNRYDFPFWLLLLLTGPPAVFSAWRLWRHRPNPSGEYRVGRIQ